jgi:hypothetical protein
MIVAVFGDVHGNAGGMYGLHRVWQEQHGQAIDLVLQTGDMGLWRTPEEMDAATRRRLANDPAELGWAAYLQGTQTAPVETWFVHGNHENFALLEVKEGQPVDPAGRIVFLAPGSIREFRRAGQTLLVAGLGGMEYRFGKYPIPPGRPVRKYLYPPALERLAGQKGKADVLLLHDAPLNKGLRNKFPTGSRRLTELVEALQPRFAFYGHYADPPEPFRLGQTLCAGMNSAAARRIPGRDGAMGILRTDAWEFDFVRP